MKKSIDNYIFIRIKLTGRLLQEDFSLEIDPSQRLLNEKYEDVYIYMKFQE